MSDKETTEVQDARMGTGNTAQDAPGNQQQQEVGLDGLPVQWQDEIRTLRADLVKLRSAKREAEERSLAEQGKWKELAEQRQRELEEMQPYRTKAEEYESHIRKSNEQRIERIPEKNRVIIPEGLTPQEMSAWLDRSWDFLTKPAAPALDAGARGGTGDAINVTDADRRQAETLKAAGYDTTPEAIAARRLQMLKEAGDTQ